jgi:hypothetical protein
VAGTGTLRFSSLLEHTSRLLEHVHDAVLNGPAKRHVRNGATLRAAIETGLLLPLYAATPGWEAVTRSKGQLGALWERRGLLSTSTRRLWHGWLEPDSYGGDDPGWLQRVVAERAFAHAEHALAFMPPVDVDALDDTPPNVPTTAEAERANAARPLAKPAVRRGGMFDEEAPRIEVESLLSTAL